MRHLKNIQVTDEKYAIPGKPMSIDTFKKRIAQAEQDILNGKTYTTEEARKMIFRHVKTKS